MNVTIKVEAGRVLMGLKTLARDFPKASKSAVRRALEWAKQKLAAMPGPRGGYTTPWTPLQAQGDPRAYKRTEKLGRGWKIQSISGKNAFRLINATPYIKPVHGDAYGRGQAEIHRGRWYVAFDVVRTAYDTVLRQYLAVSLRDVIRKAGFGGGEAAGL